MLCDRAQDGATYIVSHRVIEFQHRFVECESDVSALEKSFAALPIWGEFLRWGPSEANEGFERDDGGSCCERYVDRRDSGAIVVTGIVHEVPQGTVGTIGQQTR